MLRGSSSHVAERATRGYCNHEPVLCSIPVVFPEFVGNSGISVLVWTKSNLLIENQLDRCLDLW
jgi:hypothetical protein